MVPMPPKSPEEEHQLPDKCRPSWVLDVILGVIRCHAYQQAKTLQWGSRGLGVFPKDPVYIVLVEADPNPGEVLWDTLGRKVAIYEEGSL